MISGTLVKILGIALLILVAIVLILGIGTLFKGGETSKKYSNKLMQFRVLFQIQRRRKKYLQYYYLLQPHHLINIGILKQEVMHLKNL